MLTKIAGCLTLAMVLTLSSEVFQSIFVGLLVALLAGLWLRRSVELAGLRLVGPSA
jgi:hypothetical protein